MITNKDNQKDRYNEDIFEFAANSLLSGPSLLLIFFIVVVVAILVATLGNSITESYSIQQSDEEKTNNLFIIMFVVIILIIAVMGGIRYFFGTSVYAYINNLFTSEPEIDLVIDHRTIKSPDDGAPPIPPPSDDQPEPVEAQKEQVFNIPGNYYGYETAKNLCSAYGARLANYNEIEDAYENGAEWCNYGWSDGQMALFPTQEDTFNQLQDIPGHENDCGRPGINGGYMNNPHVKYGVNCYGVKPPIDDDEKFLMENSSRFPKTKKDEAREKEVEILKKSLDKVLVSPFNSNQWSRY